MLNNNQTKKTYGHAVVIGGSISGLLVARVLADQFESVTLIERGKEPTAPKVRKQVPQGYHAHLLLKSGELYLQDLFPDLVTEMKAEGSVTVDSSADLSWFHHGCWKIKYHSHLRVLTQSRPFLEWHIHRQVSDLDNVIFRYETRAKQFITTSDKTKIIGVELHNRHTNKASENLDTDLLVDASGFGTQTPKLLQELGYTAPKETSVHIGLNYTSYVYECTTSNHDWKSLIIYPRAPQQNRGGCLLTIENNRYLLTLVSYLDDEKPRNYTEFLDFAKSLPHPEIYNFIKNLTPISDLSSYYIPKTVRRHYEKLDNFPDGLVVMGDANCRFDPIFGQGMSVAAKEAIDLGRMLAARAKRQSPPNVNGLSKPFHQQVARIISTPWLLAITEAYRYPQIEGRRPFGMKFLHAYTALIFALSSTDKQVHESFMNVLHLLKEPIALFKPSILWKVLLYKIKN